MPDTVPLKEYVDKRLDELERTVDRRFLHAEDAVKTAARSLEVRLDSMNEFRAQLKDQAALMITRTESDAQHAKIDADIRALREGGAELRGKASATSMIIAIAISILSLLLGVYGITKESDKNIMHSATPTIMQSTR